MTCIRSGMWATASAAMLVLGVAGYAHSQDASASKPSGSITWYSGLQATDAQPIMDAFKKKTGITVELYTASTPTLWQRFQSEQSSGRYVADVFSILDQGSTREAIEAGYAAPLPASITSTYPKEFVDPNGFWFATRVSLTSLVYNTDLVKGDDVPTTWTDLLKPFWKGKFMMTGGPTASAGYYTDWGFLQEPSLGLDFLTALGKQEPAIGGNAATSVNEVVTGQVYAAIVGDNASWTQIEAGAPIKVVYPPVGLPSFHDYNLIVKTAPNPAGAIAFAEFLASKEGAEMFASTYALSPVPGVASRPAGRPSLTDLKLFPNTIDKADEVKEEQLKVFQSLGL